MDEAKEILWPADIFLSLKTKKEVTMLLKKHQLRFFWSILGFVFLLSLAFAQQTVEVKKYAVAVKDANIRSMPSTQGQIIAVARAGDKMEVVEDLGTWLKVRTPSGQVGYVWSKLVRVEVERTVKTPPPPKPASTPPQAPPVNRPSPMRMTAPSSMEAKFGFSFNFTYALVNPDDFNALGKFYNGQFNYAKSMVPNLSIDHPIEGLKHMMGGEVEGKYFLSPNFSLGLGFSYMSGSKSSDTTLSDPAGNYEKLSQDLKASYFGPHISLAGHFPSGVADLEAFVYGGYYFGSFTMDYNMATSFGPTAYLKNDNMKKGALGFGGGLRIGLKISPTAGIMLSGKYSYLKFTNIEGDFTSNYDSYHGTLYYVELNAPWEDKGYSMLFETQPTGGGILSSRKAELNFSGFYLSGGFFLRF